jgi:RND family efflux transporter MFP subunit
MTDKHSGFHLGRFGLVILIVAVLLGSWGIFTRLHARTELSRQTLASAVANVAVITPASAPASEELVLPATLLPFIDAPIYARTDGYLKRWLVDIGTRVKKGQLLAEIDTPEVDQQLRQGEADLKTAEANNRLAQITATRWKSLLASGLVAQQDVDNYVGDAEAKAAAEASARANVDRLRDLESFKIITAPFDGIITERKTDIGALIASGSAGTELFHIASADKLRVYISVPQSFAPTIHKGLTAHVQLSEGLIRDYPATVVSTADSLDLTTRTLLTQLELDNSHGTLLPGAYVEVHVKVGSAIPILQLPANALLFQGDGMNAVTVTSDNKLLIKPVSVGRDFGTFVEVVGGLSPGDQVVLNPPESAVNGTPVHIVAAHPTGSAAR